jgi:hypothetical protein
MMLMKKILLCVATLMAFVAGVNAQSLKQRALVYKYVVNDKAPGVHTTIKNGVKIWTNSNGDNLGEYKYSITQSEKKEADKIRAQAIDEISKKSLTKEARKKADEAVRKKLIEQKTAKNRKNDNSSSETESVFNVNTKD